MQKEFTLLLFTDRLSLSLSDIWRKTMSSENPSKKRRIVKKLDFENCVVANFRTKTRRKRKLRAKLTREVENLEESPEKEEECSSTRSPVLSQKTRFVRETSPVLMRTPTQRPKSPVLLNKRKMESVTEENTQKVNSERSSLRKSPVFKVKTSKWKSGNATTTTTTTTSQKETEQATSQRISGSDTENSYQIDDFTQDSKPSVEISSIESQQDAHSSTLGWRHRSLDTTEDSLEISLDDTCPRFVCDSPEGTSDLKDSARKNFKKNSLLGRLEKLGRKQASEKLLWQHQRQRKIVTNLKKLSVISFWNDDSRFVLKCQSLSPDSREVSFLFINSQWVPSVKRIQRDSVLRLYPPWQKVSVAGLGADVLLNVICMEILNEKFKMAAVGTDKIRFECLPLNEYETDEKLFVDSLFSSYTSSYLY